MIPFFKLKKNEKSFVIICFLPAYFLIIAGQFLTRIMGKGDKKSKKGKRWKGSYGVSRNKAKIKTKLKKTVKKATAAPAPEAPVKAKRTVKKKTEA